MNVYNAGCQKIPKAKALDSRKFPKAEALDSRKSLNWIPENP
jgi:hypothetical protein